MQTKQLLLDLLSRPSITPDDAGCMNIISSYLQKHGFNVEIKTFGDVKNFWAIHNNKSPLTVFAGHTDVVPSGDELFWKYPPFKPTESDGFLYARGAADMKSGVAAMCVAAVDFIKKYPDYPGSIAIMLTSDEEGVAQDGIKKFMPYLVDKGIEMDYVIFTEPSSVELLGDMIKNGRRGSMHVDLTVFGKQGHVAYPDNAANPIHTLGSIITKLSQEIWCKGNDDFPDTSLQIWDINVGAGASNVIPGKVNLKFNFRFSNEINSDTIKKRVEKIVKDELDNEGKRSNKSYKYELSYNVSGEPFLTREGVLIDAMRDSCAEILGVSPVLSTSGGTSDARFVAPFGVEVVEFGPINKTIHQVNECIKVNDIEKLKKTYQRLLEKLYVFKK